VLGEGVTGASCSCDLAAPHRRRGREDVARLLLSYGANCNASCKKTYPIHTAVAHCNAGVVKALIEAGAEVEVPNSNRKTPMMLAVLNRDKESEAQLLAAGAYAGHLQPVVVEEDWGDMDAMLEQASPA